MIISEKQIMHLLAIAKYAGQCAIDNNTEWYAEEISILMDEIANQQSEELKSLENKDDNQ